MCYGLCEKDTEPLPLPKNWTETVRHAVLNVSTTCCICEVGELAMPRMLRTLILASISLTACLFRPATGTDIVSWPAPDGEALCKDYELQVNGQAVPVYSCRVSAVPFNQVWPGY